MHIFTKTLKKGSVHDSIKKAKSYDDLNKFAELSMGDIKILLCCDHSDNPI